MDRLKILLIKNAYLLLSIFFNTIKFIKVNILKWGKGDTFVGYLLEKIPFPYLRFFYKTIDSHFVFITGTNGKTSTTALFKHVLSQSGYSVYSNNTGSNLYRGVLSFFVLNFLSFYKNSPDFIILEIDEGSVPLVLKFFPKNSYFTFVLLNLSRDQLDRYGEVDIIANNIYHSLKRFSPKYFSLIIDLSKPFLNIFSNFKNIVSPVKASEKLILNLGLSSYPYLQENLSFLMAFIKLHNIKTNPNFISPFNLVAGRGSRYIVNNTLVEIYLTKNPKSFNNNLKMYLSSKSNNLLIIMNDFIPDGRDVSWFYDINKKLLTQSLKNKNIYVAGSRSFDFCNLLSIYQIPFIRIRSYKDLLDLCFKYNFSKLFIMSNYSATQQVLKLMSKYKYVV